MVGVVGGVARGGVVGGVARGGVVGGVARGGVKGCVVRGGVVRGGEVGPLVAELQDTLKPRRLKMPSVAKDKVRLLETLLKRGVF